MTAVSLHHARSLASQLKPAEAVAAPKPGGKKSTTAAGWLELPGAAAISLKAGADACEAAMKKVAGQGRMTGKIAVTA